MSRKLINPMIHGTVPRYHGFYAASECENLSNDKTLETVVASVVTFPKAMFCVLLKMNLLVC